MNEKTNISQLRQKGHQVVDVFPFFNEIELLELRLKILSPYVDKFILVECPRTFTGNIKPLYFELNKHKFEFWEGKILHHVVDNPLDNMNDLDRRLLMSDISDEERWILAKTKSFSKSNEFQWRQEFFQRESIRLSIPPQSNSDLIFFSDLDEIWNPQMEFKWNEGLVYRLNQAVYLYSLNNKSNENWTSAFFTAYKNLVGQSLNDLRATSGNLESFVVTNGGWHFSYQGGAERIQTKLESFGHQEFNTRRIKKRIAKRLNKRKDVLGRNLEFQKSEEDLPPEVLAMKKELPDWFL
jgi:beta-1,4-mannosyl-glycoprotein beta-1,4-N-acetylglucosaminyltransferase